MKTSERWDESSGNAEEDERWAMWNHTAARRHTEVACGE